MKNWHLRHKIFYSIFKDKDFGDDLSKYSIVTEKNPDLIIKRALQYPVLQTDELYYPGKSYAAAVVYAKLLEKEFGENFYQSLDDPQLLYLNDPYFKRYSESKDIYDVIIEHFPFELLSPDSPKIPNLIKTIDYFYKEFLLHPETNMYAPPN